MRKMLSLFLSLVIMLVFPLQAKAAGTTYELTDLGLSVSIPDDYDVFTLDMSASDPLFKEYDLDRNALFSQFQASSIYCTAISTVRNEEIVVTMTDSPLSDLHLLGETLALSLAESVCDEYGSFGITVTDFDVYEHNQELFIRFFFHDQQKTVHGIQYYTIHNGQAINFTLRSYEGSPTSIQKNVISGVVDNIVFHVDTTVAEDNEKTDAFTYTDPDSGTSFVVPENWKIEDLSEDRETLDVKFISTQDTGLAILYGSTDIWAQTSPADRIGSQRSDFNNSALTKTDIADMLGVSETSVDEVSFNNISYYHTELKNAEYGITVTMNYLVRFDNGWMYLFQFGGSKNSAYYQDFVSLMNSVQYSESEGSSDFGIGLIAVLIIAGVAVTVIILQKRKKKTPKDVPTIIDTPKVTEENEYCYCHMCGTKLPASSKFCHNCGAKIGNSD